ncbi:MAG: alpha-mannosidase [Armatimonadota bacterium]
MPYDIRSQQQAIRGMMRAVEAAVYKPLTGLTVEAWATKEPVSYADRQTGRHLSLKPGDKWGDLFDCAWFHFTGTVPEECAGQQVVLLIDVNGEACVVDSAGNPVQGLTNVNSVFDTSLGKPGKRVVLFAAPAKGGEKVSIWADAGCNDLLGEIHENGTLKEALIAIKYPTMSQLFYDIEVLNELLGQLPQDSARACSIRTALYDASHIMRDYTEDEAKEARAILAPELAKKGGDSSLTISAIGHAHIDLAWLWPIRETIRKGARTFSTTLSFMDRYPDYVFGASQPQLYQWMKDNYPSVYEQIKAKVAEGRWEVQGAMWVEADTNVPSGESLVRQLLYGKRFFRKEFGIDVKSLWLPDVFGYSGALPQLLKQADVDYFMTQKLSWNVVNRHPHHTFRWRGIDGSEVLAHMIPEETYNSPAAPRSLVKSEKNFSDKGTSDACLMLFGIGDGGGGPGEEHLERLAREKDLAGLPPLKQEFSADFFEKIAPKTSSYPVWSGELYLEKHQGTYTSQGRNKRWNRRMELALRDCEWLNTWAHQSVDAKYPAADLEKLWKETLLYQFHDILPGSSITRVYEESRARYKEMFKQTESLVKNAGESLLAKIDTSAMKQPAVVLNALSWERDGFVQVDKKWAYVHVPSFGYTAIDTAKLDTDYKPVTAASEKLENDKLCVKFNADGSISSVWDKELNREALAAGEVANKLAVYEDNGDGWDFPLDYDKKAPAYFKLESSKAAVDGPKATVEQVYKFNDSTFTQEISLVAGSRRIDFTTNVDWRETHKMLRTSFPVAVKSDYATCEVQFGNIKRPTHRNTSWDQAKVEVCAQKWVDISDRGYGVAVLNTGKYGYKTLGNTIDINLLRSATYPDPVTDKGQHEFTYSLFPHTGDHVEGCVVKEAYELNVPMRLSSVDSHPGTLPEMASFCSVDSPHIIVETIKKAEDSDAVIVRLYEAHGASGSAKVTMGFPVKSASKVNLLEESPEKVKNEGNVIQFAFQPFEVITLAVEAK